jgi:ribosomal-protein-alanine N-acetyltransferase
LPFVLIEEAGSRLRLPMMWTTPRLILRELIAADAPFVLALMSDPSFIAQIGDRGVRTVEDAQRYIESGPWTRYSTVGFGLWLVQLRENGEPIGICGLLKRETLSSPDIGFAFRPQFWSKGYAFESACAVMEFAARQLHLPRILAVARSSNTASIHLLEKLGFEIDREPHALNAPDVALYVATRTRSGANRPR